MTSPYETKEMKHEECAPHDVSEQVRQLGVKVDALGSRLDEQRHLLHEILDSVSKENGNGVDWYDLYEDRDYD